jgi:hypothetical protein
VSAALAPHQQIGTGGGEAGQQGSGGEVAVGQQQHPGRRLPANRAAYPVSPVLAGPKTASMMLRVPQATRASTRIVG